MVSIRKCYIKDYPELIEIWERSVRSSHDFLSETDIQEIKEMMTNAYFPNVDLSCCEENGVITGFIGISGNMIEMLFIDSLHRGKGYGTALINMAIKSGAIFVDVNEHNPSALIFYKTRGFNVISRSETDDAGRPYPILHMSLK